MSAVLERPLLQVRNLQAGYGRSQVLFGVDLDIPARGGVAVLGRNGVGKTTLLRTLMGELRASSGEVLFDGEPITAARPEVRARRGLGCVPQEHAVFSLLSVRDNLRMGAMAHGGRGGIDRALEVFPKLALRLDQAAGSLSGGERKMVAIGRALLASPRLLLLDEPTEGVWIGVIDEIAERLALLAREIAVVVVEQNLDMVWRVCETACVLDQGRVALCERAETLRCGDRLRRYLAP